jgi:hypothetical protein
MLSGRADIEVPLEIFDFRLKILDFRATAERIENLQSKIKNGVFWRYAPFSSPGREAASGIFVNTAKEKGATDESVAPGFW